MTTSLPLPWFNSAIAAAKRMGRDFDARPLTRKEQADLVGWHARRWQPITAGSMLAGPRPIASMPRPAAPEVGQDDPEVGELGGVA